MRLKDDKNRAYRGFYIFKILLAFVLPSSYNSGLESKKLKTTGGEGKWLKEQISTK